MIRYVDKYQSFVEEFHTVKIREQEWHIDFLQLFKKREIDAYEEKLRIDLKKRPRQ